MTYNSNRKCIECGKLTGHHTVFCSKACKSASHNRRSARGALCYDALMLFRNDDRAVKQGFAERLILQLEAWEAEDKTAGRTRTTRQYFDVNNDLPARDR